MHVACVCACVCVSECVCVLGREGSWVFASTALVVKNILHNHWNKKHAYCKHQTQTFKDLVPSVLPLLEGEGMLVLLTILFNILIPNLKKEEKEWTENEKYFKNNNI